jgi:hypothetical protein
MADADRLKRLDKKKCPDGKCARPIEIEPVNSNCALGAASCNRNQQKELGRKADNLEWLNNTDIDNSIRKIIELYKADKLTNIKLHTSPPVQQKKKNIYHQHFQMDLESARKLAGKQLGHFKIDEMLLTNIAELHLNKEIDFYCVVMNTDSWDGGGIHWYPIVIDFTHKPVTIEYWNSSGTSPPLGTDKWLCAQQVNLNKHNIPNRIVISKGIQHQQDTDSECGLYSIYYILCRLLGVSPEQMNQKRISDATVNELRRLL